MKLNREERILTNMQIWEIKKNYKHFLHERQTNNKNYQFVT